MRIRDQSSKAKLWGGLLSIVLVAGALVSWARHEPAYGGKNLGEWLKILSSYSASATGPGVAEVEAAEDAILGMGEAALPHLVTRLRSHDGRLSLRLRALLERQNLVQVNWPTAQTKRSEALRAFYLLGPDAKPAVCSLTNLLQSPDAGVRADAVRALGFINPEAEAAIPAFELLLAQGHALSADQVYILSSWLPSPTKTGPGSVWVLGSPALPVSLGDLYVAAERDAAAIKAYRAAADSGSRLALERLGDHYRRMGDTVAAAEAYRRLYRPDDTAPPGSTQSAQLLNSRAWTQVVSPEPLQAQLLLVSGDTVKVWLNGEQIGVRMEAGENGPWSRRAPVALAAGTNSILVKVANHIGGWTGGWGFQLAMTQRDGSPLPPYLWKAEGGERREESGVDRR